MGVQDILLTHIYKDIHYLKYTFSKKCKNYVYSHKMRESPQQVQSDCAYEGFETPKSEYPNVSEKKNETDKSKVSIKYLCPMVYKKNFQYSKILFQEKLS